MPSMYDISALVSGILVPYLVLLFKRPNAQTSRAPSNGAPTSKAVRRRLAILLPLCTGSTPR